MMKKLNEKQQIAVEASFYTLQIMQLRAVICEIDNNGEIVLIKLFRKNIEDNDIESFSNNVNVDHVIIWDNANIQVKKRFLSNIQIVYLKSMEVKINLNLN